MSNIVEIDADFLHNSEQVITCALSLSSILGVPIRVINIRRYKFTPGLGVQLLNILNALTLITKARVVGNYLRSSLFEFEPKEICAGNYKFDAYSVNAITTMYKAILPVLLFAKSKSTIEVTGGTNVPGALQIEFMTEVLGRILKQFGIEYEFLLIRRGYKPHGKGQCALILPPVKCLKSVHLTHFGSVNSITGWVYSASRIPKYVAENAKYAVIQEIHYQWPHRKWPCKIVAYKEPSYLARDDAVGLNIKCTTTGGCVIGASGLRTTKVSGHMLGTDTIRHLCMLAHKGYCVDNLSQDKLLIYMALAEGKSEICTQALTLNSRVAFYVIQQLTGVRFDVNCDEEGRTIISCEGLAHFNKYMSR